MKLFIFLFLLMLNSMLTTAQATSVLPISLQQLSTRAPLIFYGEVLSNTVKKDEQSGYIVTLTEFKIVDLIKGEANGLMNGDGYTIKQIGGRMKGTGTTLRVHGIPGFLTGNFYVVFLPERSALGFSSPLGLHQGSFSVSTVNEQKVVTGSSLQNGTTNNASSVQLPLAVDIEKPSQANLSDFINTVRAYNAQ